MSADVSALSSDFLLVSLEPEVSADVSALSSDFLSLSSGFGAAGFRACLESAGSPLGSSVLVLVGVEVAVSDGSSVLVSDGAGAGPVAGVQSGPLASSSMSEAVGTTSKETFEESFSVFSSVR